MVARIRELCARFGTNIKQLEKTLGLGNGVVSRWDIRRPSVDSVAAVAAFFGVSMEFLLHGEEKQPTVPDGLSPEEDALLTAFRALTPDEQRFVLRQLSAAAQAEAAPASAVPAPAAPAPDRS